MQLRLDGSRKASFRRVIRDEQGRATDRVLLFQPGEPQEISADDCRSIQKDLGKSLWIVKQANARGKVEVDAEATLAARDCKPEQLADCVHEYERREAEALTRLIPILPVNATPTSESQTAEGGHPTADATDDAATPTESAGSSSAEPALADGPTTPTTRDEKTAEGGHPTRRKR